MIFRYFVFEVHAEHVLGIFEEFMEVFSSA